MRTPNRVDTSTLGWVKSEIDQTLSEAREALQRYVDGHGDFTPLRVFANSVHQVAGTLQMVELDGAAQLAQETESLATAVVAGKIDGTSNEVANSLLSEGLTQLSRYMERLASGRPDRPIDNVDVINELRRARQAEELEPYSLFNPDLEVYPAREQGSEFDTEYTPERILELRRKYQAALLTWLRDQADEEAWQVMADVVTKLYEFSRFQVSMQIWWVARAYLDVLRSSELVRDDPRKHPLAALDQLMRKLTEESEAAIAREKSEKVLRFMLYHVGRSDVRTSATRAVIRLFELDTLLGTEPEETPLPKAATFASIRDRVMDSLHVVQETLDRYSRTHEADFSTAQQDLREISQTASELGVNELADITNSVYQLLFEGETPDHSEEALLTAARALLFVDETLKASEDATEDWRQEALAITDQLSAYTEWSDTSSLGIESHEVDTAALDTQELKRLMSAVAGQIEDNLKQAEQNLEQFAKDTSDTDSLSAVLTSVRQVHGAVRMLGRHKLSDLLQMAIEQIQALIAGDAYPTDELMDALAVSIGTTDAYVRGIEREVPNADSLLNRAMEEFETVVKGTTVIKVDPVAALHRIQESFATWIKNNSDYDAFRTLRQNLRDIGALAHQQEQLNVRRIAQEMTNLLDIVTDDPSFLSEEVEATLHKSLDTLSELSVSLKKPVLSDAADSKPGVPTRLPAAGEDDEVVRETFAEEASECLKDIEAGIEKLKVQPDNAELLTDVRRNFHTIKGSGRMARARDLAELAWVVEDVLNHCLDGDVPLSKPIINFASDARGELRVMLEQGLDSITDLASWRKRAGAVQQAQEDETEELDVVMGLEEDESGSEEIEIPAIQFGEPGEEFREEVDDSFGTEIIQETQKLNREQDQESAQETEHAKDLSVDDDVQILKSIEDLGDQGHSLIVDENEREAGSPFSDDEVIEIFSKEALSHIATIRSVVDECRRNGRAPIEDELLRSVHTLQGNARSLHLVEMSEAYTVLDSSLHKREVGNRQLKKEDMDVLDALLVATAKVLDHLNRDKRFPDVVRKELADLAVEIEKSWDGEATRGTDSLEGLELVSDFVAETTQDSSEDTAADEHSRVEEESNAEEESNKGSVFDELVEVEASGESKVEHHTFTKPTIEPVTDIFEQPDDAPSVELEIETVDDDVDDVLRDVFMEEATDILSRFESALDESRRSSLDSRLTDTLKRELHTLKGSSRTAGATEIGDLSHDAETMLERVSAANPPPDLLETMEEVHDTLANMVHGLEAGKVTEPDPRLVQRLRGDSHTPAVPEEKPLAAPEEAPEVTPEDAFDSKTESNKIAVPLIPEEGISTSLSEERSEAKPEIKEDVPFEPAKPPAETSNDTQGQPDTARPTGTRTTVRIHSNVLDKLVNYAGEVSISRAQLEEQLSGLKSNLNELRANVARFSDQVRELDIQADTQIRARVAEETVPDLDDEFDPLEMDRYSRLQQLSRSLSESVDDLVTIQSGLNRFAAQTEGVLSQQALLNSELQDGLMSARMVPFNTLVPRLRHQARQTARELNKDIEFTVTGAELEVDRNILDQISEALEHMIRNSLDHGIEASEVRRKSGKPARASIKIECRQEGNEVVLRFSDDGAGLNVERIKTRAIEAGLLAADSDLNDDEVIQLIVLSGFSTAKTVTQLSGRGIGLDVVNDAVRRLGGSLTMDNRPTQGVSFELRLPLSLSITQAMFVRCGEQRFAIPLGVIETVLKTEPENLVELSKDGDPVFRQGDRVYPLMDLTAVLRLEPTAVGKRVSVLLVRMGARDVALKVDDLIGTDEIVVKQLGDYLGHLSGINGATITGDGSVVLILDIAELWLAHERLPSFKHEVSHPVDAAPRVMVVDDSLTVRKVTGRNLGRRGMEVMMARDGVDALEQLATAKPDLMLVDIEMPRMDGYELTRKVREEASFRDIPIIVITSRAGAKHRQRAMELGANAYLTKPYQEQELLDEVNALLKTAPRSTVH